MGGTPWAEMLSGTGTVASEGEAEGEAGGASAACMTDAERRAAASTDAILPIIRTSGVDIPFETVRLVEGPFIMANFYCCDRCPSTSLTVSNGMSTPEVRMIGKIASVLAAALLSAFVTRAAEAPPASPSASPSEATVPVPESISAQGVPPIPARGVEDLLPYENLRTA